MEKYHFNIDHLRHETMEEKEVAASLQPLFTVDLDQ